jgi:CRISPR-associated protein Cmr3
MTSKAYKLTPVDTWFFRDGRPFNQGESNLADIKSLFPPFAMTAVGAIRASLARGLGWNGKGDWSSNIKKKLGDGRHLGPLRFRGPYLIKERNGKSETLFPAPLHLLGKLSENENGQWEQLNLLKPGEKVNCDIGNLVRLPSIKNSSGLKPLFGSYLTLDDMSTVLKGGDLSKVCPVQGSDLWDFDFQVGIERDFETHTTVEGALYSISRVRLECGVALALEVDGLGTEMDLQSTLPFGGEGRLAHADCLDDEIEIPDAPALNPCSDNKIRFTVTHLTPANFEGLWPGPGKEIPNLAGAKVVSACLERPVWVGGWDTIKGEPLPLRPFLPGGSTWFCEAESNLAQQIEKCNGQHIGNYGEFGFGEIAIGIWNDELLNGD